MTEQPEALRIADDRPLSLDDDLYQWAIDAEDALRRQHAEIERLGVDNQKWIDLAVAWAQESKAEQRLSFRAQVSVLEQEAAHLREYSDTLVRERNEAWAESAELRADAARFVWWFSDAQKSKIIAAEYLWGRQADATLDEWRAAIDAAMEAK